MEILHWIVLISFILGCQSGPMEDIAMMPDLSMFYQQLLRQQDLQMQLQGMFPQQPSGGSNDFTIFAPNNEAMTRLNRKNEDPNFLWRYHIVPGRYDDQMLLSMAQEKLSQVNPRQAIGMRVLNQLPTIAMQHPIFYGFGFYGGTSPQVNDTYDNAGYGTGGISWLTHTSINQTNLFYNNNQLNPNTMNNNYNPNPNFALAQGSMVSPNRNAFLQNSSNYYGNVFNPSVNAQFLQNPNAPTMNSNPNFQQQQQQQPQPQPRQQIPMYQQWGSNNGVGMMRPTINNAFILQSLPMSRGIINVIDTILWPPERRDQAQFRTAYDTLEDAQFSRLRQLAERSEYFRSELRSVNQQTWFLPNDQAFASMGSALSYLLDQSAINNTNDINEFIRSHILPIVLYPSAMDSTKQVISLSPNKWITFRKVTQPDQAFQIDVISGRQVARILVSRSEDIRICTNGVVYPISTILSVPVRTAVDELTRNYQYFMNLIQQSGDLELMSILQGMISQNMFAAPNSMNVTVLIPQQMSVQQLGNSQELSTNLRRHILRFPVYVDQLSPQPAVQSSYFQQNTYPNGQQQPIIPVQQQPSFIPPGYNPQQNQFQLPQFQRTATGSNKEQSRTRRQITMPNNQNFPNQQYPQQTLPNQQYQQQVLPNQQYPQQALPNQQYQQQQQQPVIPTQQQFPSQQQPLTPNQQPLIPTQQQFPSQQQPLTPNQQPLIPNQQQPLFNQQQQQQPIFQGPPQQPPNPNAFPTASFSPQVTFQNGQVYQTMDPQFTIQAQTSIGPNGNIVTLVGRTANSLPFQATILNSESNILIRNGVMHVIRGLLSGTTVTLDSTLMSIQGASSFAQMLQQTGVLDQLRQSGRPYTLFIPTNGALQSIGVSNNMNQLRQFVLRHICADILLDPVNNVIRRSAGYYNRERGSQSRPSRLRRKRQAWSNMQLNGSTFFNQQNLGSAPNLGQGYFQTQQQTYGGYPAAPSPYGSNNQMYNPAYVMNGQGSHNSPFVPGYNATMTNNPNVNPGMMNNVWNRTMTNNPPVQRQGGFGMMDTGAQNAYQAPANPFTGAMYMSGPQSCMAMTGERVTVQSLPGTQPEGNAPSMSYYNYMVTCCGDPSVNAMVQSYNVYPPNFAVYLIGRSLISQGQSITNMFNDTSKLISSPFLFIVLFLSIIFKQIQHY